MPGGGWTAVVIPGVLGKVVHVMEYDAFELANLECFRESDVHEHRTVESLFF